MNEQTTDTDNSSTTETVTTSETNTPTPDTTDTDTTPDTTAQTLADIEERLADITKKLELVYNNVRAFVTAGAVVTDTPETLPAEHAIDEAIDALDDLDNLDLDL